MATPQQPTPGPTAPPPAAPERSAPDVETEAPSSATIFPAPSPVPHTPAPGSERLISAAAGSAAAQKTAPMILAELVGAATKEEVRARSMDVMALYVHNLEEDNRSL